MPKGIVGVHMPYIQTALNKNTMHIGIKGYPSFWEEITIVEIVKKRKWICTGKVSFISKSPFLSPTISTKKGGFIIYWRRFIAHNNAHALVNNSQFVVNKWNIPHQEMNGLRRRWKIIRKLHNDWIADQRLVPKW